MSLIEEDQKRMEELEKISEENPKETDSYIKSQRRLKLEADRRFNWTRMGLVPKPVDFFVVSPDKRRVVASSLLK